MSTVCLDFTELEHTELFLQPKYFDPWSECTKLAKKAAEDSDVDVQYFIEHFRKLRDHLSGDHSHSEFEISKKFVAELESLKDELL